MLDLYEFEASEAAVLDGGAGEAGAAPSPEAGATGEAAPPPSAETEAAPAWSADDPGFRDAVAQESDAIVQARLAEFLQQIEQTATPGQQQQAQPLPDFDPFDPASVQAYNEARDARMLQQMEQLVSRVTQPMEAREEAEMIARGDELAKDMIAADIASHGDITDEGKQAIEPLANLLVAEFASRYGMGPRAAEAAISKAAGIVRGIEKAAADKALAEHTNRNSRLAGLHAEPGAGSGVQTRPEGPYAPGELSRKYGAQASSLRGI